MRKCVFYLQSIMSANFMFVVISLKRMGWFCLYGTVINHNRDLMHVKCTVLSHMSLYLNFGCSGSSLKYIFCSFIRCLVVRTLRTPCSSVPLLYLDGIDYFVDVFSFMSLTIVSDSGRKTSNFRVSNFRVSN